MIRITADTALPMGTVQCIFQWRETMAMLLRSIERPGVDVPVNGTRRDMEVAYGQSGKNKAGFKPY